MFGQPHLSDGEKNELIEKVMTSSTLTDTQIRTKKECYMSLPNQQRKLILWKTLMTNDENTSLYDYSMMCRAFMKSFLDIDLISDLLDQYYDFLPAIIDTFPRGKAQQFMTSLCPTFRG